MLRSLLFLAGAVLAADQTTTMDVLILGDKQSLAGSVVNVDSQATTVFIQCKKDTPSEFCGLPSSGATIVQGPSTWHWSFGISDATAGVYTHDAGCKLDPPQNVATCQITVTEDVSGHRTTSSSSVVETGYKSLIIPVSITAGAEKLAASPTASGGAAAPTKTNAANPAAAVAGKNAVVALGAAVAGGLLVL